MAWLQQRGKKWGVGWYTLAGVGRWRSCPTKPVARRLKLQIESAIALGRDWEPDRPREAAGLEEVFRKYLEVRSFDLAQRTLVRYGYALDVCLQFARDRAQGQPKINVLSRAFLEDYRIWLSKNGTGRHAGSRSFATVVKLIEPVELAWNWADESERWQDVPRPRRLGLKQPRTRHAVAASFDEYDGMLGGMLETIRRYPRCPEGAPPDWAYRVALLSRTTALRRTAAVRIEWAAVDLDALALDVPDDITKGERSGRRVPIHPALATELRTWGPTKGTIVKAPAAECDGRGHVDRTMRRAWQRAGVREAVWRGQPLHVARKMLRTHYVGVGVQSDLIDVLLGHAGVGSGGRHTTDRGPLWQALVDAVATVPSHLRSTPALIDDR